MVPFKKSPENRGLSSFYAPFLVRGLRRMVFYYAYGYPGDFIDQNKIGALVIRDLYGKSRIV